MSASRLRGVYALTLKELRSYFDTPAAYVVTFSMLLISGYLFASPLFVQNRAAVSGFTDIAPLLLLFFIPAVTMRLYAEELKSGTIEVIATLPVEDEDILAAKFLAALSVLSFMLAATVIYPSTVSALGNLDWGAALGAYLGLWLTGAVLASIGIWASSLTRNQVVAFILSFLFSFTLFLLGKVHDFIPYPLNSVTDFLGFDSHYAGISRGVFDTRDLLYYASMSGYFLYLTFLNAHSRRLRGG